MPRVGGLAASSCCGCALPLSCPPVLMMVASERSTLLVTRNNTLASVSGWPETGEGSARRGQSSSPLAPSPWPFFLACSPFGFIYTCVDVILSLNTFGACLFYFDCTVLLIYLSSWLHGSNSCDTALFISSTQLNPHESTASRLFSLTCA